jgi:hypothetical protein
MLIKSLIKPGLITTGLGRDRAAWKPLEANGMLIRFCAFFLTLTLSPVFAANWYLDVDANGAGTGKSWTDAWKAPTSVVWGGIGVKPGDTLFISGGATSKIYANGLSIGISGTSENPIRIRIGQEPDHNGVAILSTISYSTNQFVVVDGSRQTDFVPPKSVWEIEQIKPNIGIRLTRPDNVGIFVSGTGGENNTVRWVEVGPIGTVANIGDIHGLRFLNLTSLTNWVVEYCWLHDIQNDAISHNTTANNPEYFDALTVRWCLIERTGDDGIQTSCNGITIQNCFLRDHWKGLYNGHPDQIQFAGASMRYFKVVNNIIRNKANSLIIAEHLAIEGGQLGPMLIAGNVFYNTRDWYYKDIQAYGATFSAWRPNADVSVNQCTWNGFYLLNNTFYYQRTEPFSFGRVRPDDRTRSVWRLDVINSAVRNNLMLDCKYNTDAYSALNVGGNGDPGSGTNGIYYKSSDLPFTHNIVAGINKSASYRGTIYPDVTGAANGNSSAMPNVISITNYDFRLANDDKVAKDQGISLAGLTNQFPELMVDLWGNLRGNDGAWDIGANEAAGATTGTNGGDASLLLALTFDDDLTDGRANDSSGRGNHGIRFGHQSTPTNWPASSTYVHPFTKENASSARFRWYAQNGWGLYSKSGDYVAITNIAGGGLQSLNRATVMLRVKRNPAPDGDGNGLNEWQDDQGRYICSGYGYTGAWSIGMFTDRGVPYSYVRVYTNNSAAADAYAWFGEGSRVVTGGSVNEGALPWTHFAFTWDNGVLKTYCNGTNISSTTLPISELTVRGPNGSLSTGWIGLGCDTHNGNPWLTPNDDTGDQYPNHAWFNGEMDDVMIYGRVLSNEEIQASYRGSPLDPRLKPPAPPWGLNLRVNSP